MSSSDWDRRSEIDAFKELNLSVIASNFGYRIVRSKSTRHSVLMESGNDKIIVSKNGRHYVYCSVFSDHSGTAIDFAQRVIEPGATLGRVRQLLRPFLDGVYFSSVERQHEGQFAKRIRPSSTDFLAVAARYSQFEPITGHHDYLCSKRKIPLELLLTERLKGRVRHCPNRGSVIFPHWGPPDTANNDDRIVTGYEIKGPSINMFSKSGRKGLWCSAGFRGDRVLAFTESGLDALSYLALCQRDDVRVVSISGQLNSHQPALIRSAILQMGEGAEIVAAFDNDVAGARLSESVRAMTNEVQLSAASFIRHGPGTPNADWNDVLRLAR